MTNSMQRTSNLKRILIAAAIIEIAVGLLHFAMPYFAYASSGFQQLQSNELGFVTLVTFATGILLIAFGCVTLLLANNVSSASKIVEQYLYIKIGLWFGRIILEIFYPVALDMFYIDRPIYQNCDARVDFRAYSLYSGGILGTSA